MIPIPPIISPFSNLTANKLEVNMLNPTYISGAGFYVPERVVSNLDLENIIDTSDAWIQTRTGIRERRIAAANQSTSDLAVEAGRRAMANAMIDPCMVDLLIIATLSPDMMFPATACTVQKKLGLTRAVAFDIGAACSGFIYALSVATQFLSANSFNTALIIGAEVFSRFINWQDRSTCVLFGDGAGAIVIQNNTVGHKILSTHLGSDGTGYEHLCLPAGGSRLPASVETLGNNLHYIHMNGKEVYKYAVKAMSDSVVAALEKANMSIHDIDLLIPHQANKRIMEGVAERLGLSLRKVFVNIDRYGNTSAASIPIALCEAIGLNIVNKGDVVVFTGFGAGFTWGSTVVNW